MSCMTKGLSVSTFLKNISYNSCSNTEAIKGPEITLAKRECLCEAKLQALLTQQQLHLKVFLCKQ